MKNKFKIGLISVKQGDSSPPSSLVYIGTYLRKHLGSDIDLKIIDQNFQDVEKSVREENFDLIGQAERGAGFEGHNDKGFRTLPHLVRQEQSTCTHKG